MSFGSYSVDEAHCRTHHRSCLYILLSRMQKIQAEGVNKISDDLLERVADNTLKLPIILVILNTIPHEMRVSKSIEVLLL